MHICLKLMQPSPAVLTCIPQHCISSRGFLSFVAVWAGRHLHPCCCCGTVSVADYCALKWTNLTLCRNVLIHPSGDSTVFYWLWLNIWLGLNIILLTKTCNFETHGERTVKKIFDTFNRLIYFKVLVILIIVFHCSITLFDDDGINYSNKNICQNRDNTNV